jgi:hypothetical protein
MFDLLCYVLSEEKRIAILQVELAEVEELRRHALDDLNRVELQKSR